MLKINVLVVSTSRDVEADVIAESVAARADMSLVGNRCLSLDEVAPALRDLPPMSRCALIFIGHHPEAGELTTLWISERADLVVTVVDIITDHVRITRTTVGNPRLASLLDAVRRLVDGAEANGRSQITHVDLTSPRPLLDASIAWVHQLLRDAVASGRDQPGEVPGLCPTRATLLQALDSSPMPVDTRPEDLQDAEKGLEAALEAASVAEELSVEPLAIVNRELELTSLEFRLLVMGLAPELDLRFQRCLGFLLDEMPRRVGTLGLYSALLGRTSRVREDLAQGALARWPIFDATSGLVSNADEPLRLDPCLAQWILGDRDALTRDPRVRRVLRLVPWSGGDLLVRHEERARAAVLAGKLLDDWGTSWLLLSGSSPASSRALLEHGARARHVTPLRVEAARLAGADIVDVEECARRLGRLRRLSGHPIVIDLAAGAGAAADDDALRLFFATIASRAGTSGVIAIDDASAIRLIGVAPLELISDTALSVDAMAVAVRTAAAHSGVYLTAEAAETLTRRFPLQIDDVEHAMCLARSRPKNNHAEDPALSRFTAACKEIAAAGISQLADRIEPQFNLDDVVLPPDRHQQLVEIVDNVRLAPRVLDEWKFRDQLPYGRGVSALFFGPSGTGKTMGAIGIAHRLGIQLLRLDLSRVVSKYIGDTEKNIDRVFTDAQRSGSAILIDEADALLGKRSEVKDAHDRYANIEVAYLLQRMEAYEGLAILTSNMRQNLDPAFLRRLRFIVEFPRPDVDAREKIWRQCLPTASHTLDDAAFRQLARKIDLTGGHIRQITLRAAFIAAAAGTQIALEHIDHAARAEFAKLGMPPVELDLRSRQAA